MNILLFMSSGLDTPGPSWHLYTALIEDLVSYGHKVHLIESHSTGINPDCPERLKGLENFSYETINIETVAKKAFAKRYLPVIRPAFGGSFLRYTVLRLERFSRLSRILM